MSTFVPNERTDDLFKDFTVSFPGGSITTTKDVLLCMFKNPDQLQTCGAEFKDVRRQRHERSLYPGGPKTWIEETPYKKYNWSNGGTSRAAGGEPIAILINGDMWTARLQGSHQSFMNYLCANRAALAPGFTYWESNKGKPYSVSSTTTDV